MGEMHRYGTFISYRHTDPDRRWAKWLHTRLETYRVPRRLVAAGAPARLGRVFRDEEELPASADLTQSIDEALAESGFLVVICSPRTPGSRWVNEEVQRFQALGRADRLLALLIEGDPAQSFPPALLGVEPLAADARPVQGESGRAVRKTALLKLLAGVLGIHYDDLRRREEERTRRRLTLLAGSAVVLALTFLGLSLLAWQQWRRAERELRVSRAQALAAEAEIADATTPDTDVIGSAGPERGVLLALESLNAYPTLAGDRVLRTGLWKLPGPPLKVPAGGQDLKGVGPQGRWLLFEAEGGERIFEVATRTYRNVTPARGTAANEVGPASATGEETGDAGTEILARSADRKLYLVRSEEGVGGWVFASAALHRASDGKKLAVLPHEWQIELAAFSPDGRWLVTVTSQASADSEDNAATVLVGSTVRVWEVPSGRKVTEVSLAGEGGISQVRLSPDGGWLATLTHGPATGSQVLLWPLRPEALRAEACKRLTRNLSFSEWETFVRTQPYRSTCPGLPMASE